MNFIDLRSDTVTNPTDAMREAMYRAEVGDDGYDDDPTVKELESLAAEMMGKESALFVPSGIFGNQLALLTHCKRGSEVILDDNCHIVAHEVGASSVIAGVQLRTLNSNKGILDPLEIKKKIRKESDELQYPGTSLICIENAHSNGRVIPIDNMKTIYSIAKENDVPVHLDGARIFNAASYLKVDVKEITKYCDSIMFCLSKGLCAPVGSILAGSKDFIKKAIKGRKLMGGGLRQSGILAAAGLVALKDMVPRVSEDHENALYLADLLSELPGVKVNREDIHINMVFFEVNSKLDGATISKEFLKRGIKINTPENGMMRFVTHYWITKEHIEKVVAAFREILML